MSHLDDIQSKLIGRQVRIHNYRDIGVCLQHERNIITQEKIKNTNWFLFKSTFNIVPGLAGKGISFESVDNKNNFIRHYYGTCFLDPFDNSDLFKNDATWIPSIGFCDNNSFSFQSANFKGEYMTLRRQDNRIIKFYISGNLNEQDNATWKIDIAKDIETYGKWDLVYGTDNETSSLEWDRTTIVGSTKAHVDYTKEINKTSWGSEVSCGVEFFGLFAKTSLKAGGEHSVEHFTSDTWSESKKVKIEEKYKIPEGKPFYFWQWNFYTRTVDGIVIQSNTNLYEITTDAKQPAKIPFREEAAV